jgi:hypothetical protein
MYSEHSNKSGRIFTYSPLLKNMEMNLKSNYYEGLNYLDYDWLKTSEKENARLDNLTNFANIPTGQAKSNEKPAIKRQDLQSKALVTNFLVTKDSFDMRQQMPPCIE